MRSKVVLAAICLVCTAAAQERIAPQHRSAAATRKIVAELLKISLADPKVSVTVHGTREEDGLTLEDISWESLDGENPPAFLIRTKVRVNFGSQLR
jgi:hypothetical protein